MSKRMIKLKSSDNVSFEVEESIALQSHTIAHLVEDECADGEIPLANVTAETLTKVIEYCTQHANGSIPVVVDPSSASSSALVPSSSDDEDMKKWDAEFMKTDQSMIFELILAANYLNIQSLLDLSCQTVADQIAACRSANEIRKKFSIENDFTPEEEEQVRKENQWAFEEM